jgi:hypothetical protein
MMRVPDGKLAERQLVAEEGRCRRRNLTIEQVFADLHRLLGHSAGDSKSERVRDLAEALEVGESSITNVLYRLVAVGDTLLTAMYGDEPCGTLHPDWAAEPEDWGPIAPWGADNAPQSSQRTDTPSEPVSTAAPLPAAAAEPEAAIPPPPATIPPAPVPLAQAVAEAAAVTVERSVAVSYVAAEPVAVPLRAPPAVASDCVVDAGAIAEAVAPVIADPISAAIDLLRDKRELAGLRLKYCENKVSEATRAFDAAEADVMKITAAIEVLEGLNA